MSVLFGENQAGLLEQIQMMRNGRLADSEAVGDIAGGHILLTQMLQNRASRRVVQGLEQLVHDF